MDGNETTVMSKQQQQQQAQYVFVKNYDQSTLAQWLKESVTDFDFTKNNAVFKWLQDLRMMSENECLCVLQAKSLMNKFLMNNTAATTTTLTTTMNQTASFTNGNSSQTTRRQKNRLRNHQQQQNHFNNSLNSTTTRLTQSINTSMDTLTLDNLDNDDDDDIEEDLLDGDDEFDENDDDDGIDSFNGGTDRVQEEIQILRTKSNSISIEFTKLIRRTDKQIWQHIPHTVRKLLNYIRSVINDFNESINYHTSRVASSGLNSTSTSLSTLQILINSHTLKDEQDSLLNDGNRLYKYTESLAISVTLKKPDKRTLYELLGKLGQSYERFYQSAMRFYLRVQLNTILQKTKPKKLQSILNSTVELCLQDEEIIKIIIQENGILILFQTLCDPYYSSILDTILRAISTLCSCGDCIDSMEQVGGIGCLTHILCDETNSEWTRTEAAGCIAQITSPTLNLCHRLTGFIENMEDLVRALTNLCRDASDTEIFLIATAALAHMTFMDSIACEFLNQFNTAQIIIENCYLKNHNSIFIKDQVTTILANMALFENCREEIVDFNGLNLLSDYLNENPINYSKSTTNGNNSHEEKITKTTAEANNNNEINDDAKESELTACERVQQKAAIAINRFSKEPEYATLLVELGVVPRLVTLCRNSNERNNSDAVLVACLAALRQLALVCDSNMLKENDVQQLIRPRLRDSFLMCSSAEESYV